MTALVQSKSGPLTTGLSVSNTFTNATQAGNILIAFVVNRTNATAPTIADTQGNVWSVLIPWQTFVSQHGGAWWTTANGATLDDVTLSIGTSSQLGLIISEWSGLTSSSVTTQNTGTTGVPTTPNMSLAAYGLGIGMFSGNSPGFTTISPFASVGTFTSGSSVYGLIEYYIPTVASVVAATSTIGNNWGAIGIAWGGTAPSRGIPGSLACLGIGTG